MRDDANDKYNAKYCEVIQDGPVPAVLMKKMKKKDI
jgi:hypothetical protein